VISDEDGVLTIGLLVPAASTVQTANDTAASLSAGTRLAVDSINRHGGVLGNPVRVIIRSEADNAAVTAAVLDEFASDGVDAVIGPTSSTVAQANLADAISETVACSPAASSLTLRNAPDSGRFFRSVPADHLQVVALAELVERTGATTTSVAYVADEYGRSLFDALASALDSAGISLAGSHAYTADDTLAAIARDVADDRAATVVVLGDASSGSAAISTIDALMPATTRFVVNDALLGTGASLGSVGERVTGAAVAAYVTDDGFRTDLAGIDPTASGAFAGFAYDCVMAIALATVAANSTLPDRIAAAMPGVTDSGTACSTWSACTDVMAAQRNVDYEGVSSDMDFDNQGDVGIGTFDVFTFDDGVAIRSGQIVVG
jgi:branched-chain amino acid transport system substrate-binding protein